MKQNNDKRYWETSWGIDSLGRMYTWGQRTYNDAGRVVTFQVKIDQTCNEIGSVLKARKKINSKTR